MPVTFPLATDRLLIAPMTAADAAALGAYRSDPATARFQSWDAPYAPAEAARLLAANPGGWPAAGEWTQLGLREGGAVVGDVGVHRLGDPALRDTIEVGVTVAPAARGRGVAFEALTAVLDAVFADGAHRVIGTCDARNAVVERVFTRLGMRREGRAVDAEWSKGEWTTVDTWAVLAEEWLG